jgi:hypothetical protein
VAGHPLTRQRRQPSQRATNAQANSAIKLPWKVGWTSNVYSKTQGQGSNGYLSPKTMNPDGEEGL